MANGAEFNGERFFKATVENPVIQNLAKLVIMTSPGEGDAEFALKLARQYCDDNPWLGVSIDTPEQEERVLASMSASLSVEEETNFKTLSINWPLDIMGMGHVFLNGLIVAQPSPKKSADYFAEGYKDRA